jgi:sortase A
MSLIIKASRIKRSPLRTFNNFLTIAVVILGVYLIVMPLWPQISLMLFKNKSNPYPSSLEPNKTAQKSVPTDNRLVIPQMGLDATVHEGLNAAVLSQGIWRRPQTSTPDKNGNTVLVAHRFTYQSPAFFYHLDKLKINDTFSLYWNGKEYAYKVKEVKIVEPSEISIENQTDSAILTLYTCTPMWSAKQRLVVISDLIGDQS